MNRFSIKDIENLSGIKAHTWRIWEQRYPIGIPHRTESNHRYYDTDDLKKVLRLSFLYHQGIKISKLAGLDDKTLQQRTLDLVTPENRHQFLVKQLTEASIDFDESAFTTALHESINSLGIEQTMTEVVFPFLRQVGLLWLTNHVIPAQEHFVSNLVMQKLIAAINKLPKPQPAALHIVLFTPEKEHHEIPLLFTNYLLLSQGINTIYLGHNISEATLRAYGQTRPVTHLFFHMITNLSGKDPEDYIDNLSKQFKTADIIMAGSEAMKITTSPKNVTLLKNGDEILEFIKNLKDNNQ